jgi:hypothetical protein
MAGKRVLSWGAASAAVAAVLLTAGCGGNDVTFTPAADTSGAIQPAGGAPSGGSGGSGAAPSSSARVPSNRVITRQGSTICVRNKDTGSRACASDHGTAVVDGVVIVNGKVVSTYGSSDGSVVVDNGSVVVDNGSVVVDNGSVVDNEDAASVPTSGRVTLTGAVQWQGSASGTCHRQGEVRHTQVTLAGGRRLEIDVVGSGVVRIELATGGDTYSGNWVGDNGIVSLAGKSLKVNDAPVGRGSHLVRVTAALDC